MDICKVNQHVISTEKHMLAPYVLNQHFELNSVISFLVSLICHHLMCMA